MKNFMKPIINAIKYWTNSRIEESQINLDKKINDANIEFNRKIEESKADWDEKDSNVNSYIKNKTHYLHKNQEIFNQTLSLDEYCNYSTSLPLSSNKNYLVTINQIEFITTAVYLETETALEPELVHEGIYWGYIDNYGIYLNRPTFKPNQEIQISICEIEFKPIDKKYLSNCMTETNPVGTGTFNFNGSQSTQQGYNSFIIGQGSFTKGNDSFIAGEYLYNYNKNNSILGKNNANNSHVITKAIDKSNILNGKNSTYGYKISNITPDYSRGVFFIDVDYTPISYQSVQLNIPYIMYLSNIIDIEGRTAVRFYAIPTSKKSNYNSTFYSINYDEVSMISEDQAFIIGNGKSTSNRSNAHTLDWNGNAWFSGDVYIKSTSGVNKDEGSKKLATEEYVDTQISSLQETVTPTALILASPNGTKFTITVDNNGILTATEVVN